MKTTTSNTEPGTKRRRLLDLFCGAGGCGVGYSRVGFDVVGVDCEPQPRYPFEFVRGDALEYLADHGAEFDAIHASPPCQSYSAALKHLALPKAELIDPVRNLLESLGVPWVIENVVGAPLRCPAVVCGTGLGLPIQRHRLFECSFLCFSTTCNHAIETMNPHRASSRKKLGTDPERQWREAMGVSWMSKAEARQAIPPAYTEYIGRQLIDVLEMGA